MTELLVIALATLISEDLACIGAGVLVAHGQLAFPQAVAACMIGIFGGDLLLFALGRFGGRSILSSWLPEAKLRSASEWLTKRGFVVILLSRFTPGLRLPTYVAAGVLRTNFWRFSVYLAVAAGIWTPVLVGATAYAGERVASQLGYSIAGAAAAALTLRRVSTVLADSRRRRRIVGSLGRIVRWEFWPVWAAYLPVVPYILYLGLKNRCLTLFTSANPGIPSGGFVFESKSQILHHLRRSGSVPPFALIPSALDRDARVRRALIFLGEHHLQFPVVLKPDAGERGTNVAVIRNEAALHAYLSNATTDTIIQAYVSGVEFGIFYDCGRITSITWKQFPSVLGDGISTLEELVLHDSRAVYLANVYLNRQDRDAIPARGEQVQLVEIGSHCRGSVFVDATHLRTPALESEIRRIATAHAGFFFGRFDIRVSSPDALQRGEEIKILELNGVTSEPTHIYDPRISLAEAYRTLWRHWRRAFEIGEINRRNGTVPMSFAGLLLLIRRHFNPVG